MTPNIDAKRFSENTTFCDFLLLSKDGRDSKKKDKDLKNILNDYPKVANHF